MLCFCIHHLIILNKAIILTDQGGDMIFIKLESCQNKVKAKTKHKNIRERKNMIMDKKSQRERMTYMSKRLPTT